MEQRKIHYTGLTDQEVIESRQKNGINILTPPKKESKWIRFLNKFVGPLGKKLGFEEDGDSLIFILEIAAVLSICISCYEFYGLHGSWTIFLEPIGIIIAILLATGISFIFELKSDKEFSILNQVNDDEAVQVIRNGNETLVAKKDIVVGDIVVLDTGCEVPADGELLEATTLTVDESSLTGEPSCEKTIHEADFDENATYPSNHVMKGTKILEGHGIMCVFAVGDTTENGKVFQEAQIDDTVKTPLNEQLDGLGDWITYLSYGIAGAIIVGKMLFYFHWAWQAWLLLLPTAMFFYLVIKKFGDWSYKLCLFTVLAFVAIFIGGVMLLHQLLLPGTEYAYLLTYTLNTLMIAVTLIVVAVPEGLPLAVSLSLAYSMRSMLKTNNLVRKMHACETMGAATVICTDKTGTLTQNQMKVAETRFYGLSDKKLTDNDISQVVIESLSVNSTAALDMSDPIKPAVIGNPTEGALLLWLKDRGIDYLDIKDQAECVEELPFTTERKFMATVVKSKKLGKRVLYVKGAPEIVFSLCKSTCGDISEEQIHQQLVAYQNQAMRTLGFAYQILEQDENIIKPDKLVSDKLIFLGIVAISDPVREDVPSAIKDCLNAGIKVKIVTGDTMGTAKEIGRKIGLWTDNDSDENIITGTEFSKLSDAQLKEKVKDLKIISRARPLDKKRLVEALQSNNEVVAVTGDGTNDAPALNMAHVGLSMGAGTSVAKEASDITIIDNSFSSITRAVMWGRSLYRNIQRFLLFQLTVNVAACLIVLVGAFMGTQSPLTVTQMLWVNLIMDTFGAMALASLPPTERVMKDKPRDRSAFILDKSMLANIFGVGGFFFLIQLILLIIFENADINQLTDLLHIQWEKGSGLDLYEGTLFFTIFVMTHFWYMFDARAYKTGQSALHLHGCKGFIIIAIVILFGQIAIVELGGQMFDVTHLSMQDWLIIIIATSLVLWVGEIARLFKSKLLTR